MIIVLVVINTIIFFSLSMLHFYWAMGGEKGLSKALPEIEGKPGFKPGAFAATVVAMGLMFCALVSLGRLGIFDYLLSQQYIRGALGVVAAIFYFRSIGDFKYCGYFKKIKDTEFAVYDTKIYTPLCLLIGSLNLILAVL